MTENTEALRDDIWRALYAIEMETAPRTFGKAGYDATFDHIHDLARDARVRILEAMPRLEEIE